MPMKSHLPADTESLGKDVLVGHCATWTFPPASRDSSQNLQTGVLSYLLAKVVPVSCSTMPYLHHLWVQASSHLTSLHPSVQHILLHIQFRKYPKGSWYFQISHTCWDALPEWSTLTEPLLYSQKVQLQMLFTGMLISAQKTICSPFSAWYCKVHLS